MKTDPIKLDVIARIQDNQDGGYTILVYNNEDELIADHPLTEEHEGNLPDEERRAILNGDDEYENGYISHETIEVEFVNGALRLAKPIHLHAGQ